MRGKNSSYAEIRTDTSWTLLPAEQWTSLWERGTTFPCRNLVKICNETFLKMKRMRYNCNNLPRLQWHCTADRKQVVLHTPHCRSSSGNNSNASPRSNSEMPCQEKVSRRKKKMKSKVIIWQLVNILTTMSDQNTISFHNINTKSSRQVMRIKKSINNGIITWSNAKFSELTS